MTELLGQCISFSRGICASLLLILAGEYSRFGLCLDRSAHNPKLCDTKSVMLVTRIWFRVSVRCSASAVCIGFQGLNLQHALFL